MDTVGQGLKFPGNGIHLDVQGRCSSYILFDPAGSSLGDAGPVRRPMQYVFWCMPFIMVFICVFLGFH